MTSPVEPQTEVVPPSTEPAPPSPPPASNVDGTARSILGDDTARTPTLELRQGVINAVDLATARCTLTLGGGDTPIPTVAYLSNYKPAVGDTCWVLVNGPDLLALDRDGTQGSSVFSHFGSAVVAGGEQSRSSTAWGDLATVGPTVSTTVPSSGRLLIGVSCWVRTPNDGTASMSFAMTGANTRTPQFVNAVEARGFLSGLSGNSGSASISGTAGSAGGHAHSLSGSVSGHSQSHSFSGSASSSGGHSHPISGGSHVHSLSLSEGSISVAVHASNVSLLTGLTPGATVVTAKYTTSTGSAGFWDHRTLWVVPL